MKTNKINIDNNTYLELIEENKIYIVNTIYKNIYISNSQKRFNNKKDLYNYINQNMEA